MTDKRLTKAMEAARELLGNTGQELLDAFLKGADQKVIQKKIITEHGAKLGGVLVLAAVHAINTQVTTNK